jgi:SAM-dependent methyltransferase
MGVQAYAAASLIVALFLLALALAGGYSLRKGAPWVPTSGRRIRALLRAAGLRPGERFVDAGCGNGTACILAAREFGADAVGIEVNPVLALVARFRARRAGVAGRVRIVRRDLFQADLGQADVLFLFLLQETNVALQAKLRRELRPGARVVSHAFTLPAFTETPIPGGDPRHHFYVVGGRR